MQACHG
jgi:hypothetical protein